jgi:hypothetical protein
VLPHCRKTGGHGFCRAEKIFGRVGAKSEGTPPGVPKSFFFSVVREHDPPVKPKNGSDWRMASSEWRVANGERKTSTRNAQPNFTLYALRFTPNSQRATRNLFSGLTPLLPANFTLLRFTHYAFSSSPVPRLSSRSVM